ncbi:MAG: SRPBCC family protein [Desulfobacterales bacterium]|nr:SRPBCC family protein [Desulfobacterales bacterium]
MLPKHFSRILDAPTADVWRLITDTHAWPQWGPTVRAVDCAERYIRAGSTGRVLTPIGLWLPFAVERFEPERFWDWRVGGVAATGHWLKSLGRRQCELAFSVPFWAVGYGVVCRAALARIDRLLARVDRAI